MKLHFREMGTGSPLVILHGLFGLSDNWQTLAKYLSQQYRVFLVDLRNHGRSPHSTEFNYNLMAEDLHTFMQDQQLTEAAIMGHSMGGKVAMEFALTYPHMVTRLIVVDIAPRAYPVHHQDIINALNSVNIAGVKTRGEIDQALAQYIPEEEVRLFLSKNLYRTEDNTFAWRMNLASIEANIEEVGKETQSETAFSKPVLFIKGARSGYIKPQYDTEPIQKLFPAAQIKTVENAGHWVHAEAPQEVFNLVTEFLK
ncbi:alpha/beta fold hydrolase [Adhaeribacter rhizoryzae]|uniref:Alpha/beta fold hydrolase n=1 Tax=Adhaeribacter rhizoryzae TaxID=2607907 RepID=A0A5M6DBX2_9BACT|nr:alpha/beta fold hydrolase [Adhaeribacter rhizoryzae]KAA5543976.1 alpha/beta fold hydrolase [Adhaeribacter rhizoryzae]